MRPLALVLASVLLLAASCRPDEAPLERVTVGVGTTAEQRVLAALTLAALEREGIASEVRSDLGGTPGLRREALAGAIDLFWDYTGAAWALGLNLQEPTADVEESYERVREADRANGLTWLEPTAANATLALFVRAESVPEGQAPTLTWLATELSQGSRRLCADEDFIDRPGGWAQLADFYAIDRGVVPLAQAPEDEAIAMVAAGECFVGLGTATSGAAAAAGLVRLADDQRRIPAFVVAPVVRSEVLGEHAQLRAALAPVVDTLDTARLAALNAAAAGASAEELEALAASYLADVLPSPTS